MRVSVLILLAPVGFVTYGGFVYYRLVWLHVQSRQALQHVDEQLGKHHDYIPHLLLALCDHIRHETWAIEHVIQARYRSLAASTQEERMMASTHLSEALHHLLRISQNCSGFHADEEAVLIHMEVMLAEQKIKMARDYYNHVVEHYNEQLERFPHSIVAQLGGFEREMLFESPPHMHREFAGAQA